MSYIVGENRDQMMLLPEALDDYVSQDNPVRFIDAFVEKLDLEELGFTRAVPKEMGRPAYDPADLLKLYIYGYLNQVRSSRKLERETKRNLEVIWLMRKLEPDFKTVADFRKENLEGIKKVCREFTLMCREMGLFGGELIGVDGSKFKAVNSKERSFTLKRLETLKKKVDEKIDEYLKELGRADGGDSHVEKGVTAEQLKEKIEKMRKQRIRYEGIERDLKESNQTQVALTDSDARLMKTRHGNEVCYNVQMAVDEKHRLIVAHEVTNSMNDMRELSGIALEAKAELKADSLEVVADEGYYDCGQVKKCEEAGIKTYMTKPPLNGKRDLFNKMDFVYKRKTDVYICPAGAELTYRTTEKKDRLRIYKTDACWTCELKKQCTTAQKGRAIKRNMDEIVMDEMADRVKSSPEKLALRKTLVEHPFGTMKRAMNQGYFLMKGKKKVAAEMSLTVLAYNIRRVTTIMGVESMIAALLTG